MRIAIIHYWLLNMRGGERVIEELCRLFPSADIYTHVVNYDRISDTIKRHRIQTTSIAGLPMARRYYQRYLGFMPRALENIDLSGYDLVLSSEAGPAKGVIPPPGAKHICYCHSPMRYIWDQRHIYEDRMPPLTRTVFRHVAHHLRIWDVTTAMRVDEFIANSAFVAERIRRYYGRSSTVVHPPVDVGRFQVSSARGDYYLYLGQLVPYKRADLIVEAFRELDRPVLIVGEGEELKRLRSKAPPHVRFHGRAEANELAQIYANCRALLFPSEEDFGIVPVEAMASGKPVIAYGRGGVRETVVDGQTGLFFDQQDPASLRNAVQRFEAREAEFSPMIIRRSAERFTADAFRTGVMRVVDEVLARSPAVTKEPPKLRQIM